MKKITLLFSLFILFGAYHTIAQTNMVVNGGFETWTTSSKGVDSVANWTFSTATGQSFTRETSIVHSGTSSLLSTHTAASGTAKVYTKPYVTPVVPGTTYTFSFWYYVAAAGTTNLTGGFRMWGYWENPDGSNGTFNQTNLQPAAFIDATGNTGVWKQFTVDVVPPAGSGQVEFDIRFYHDTKVYIDDVSCVVKSTGVNNTEAQKLNVWANGNKVSFEANNCEKVEVYNSVGQKVLAQTTTEGKNELVVNNKGVTIVRVGNRVGKVVL